VCIVKKIYLFLLLLILIGCGFKPSSNTNSLPITCPSVLFASDHKIYVGTTSEIITLDNIAYQAEINNAVFAKGCQMKDNVFSSDLSLLFIVTPLQKIQSTINLPFYVAVLDENNNLRDIQYYSINGVFKKNSETSVLIETELTKTIIINLPSMEDSLFFVIGFMLDEKRLEILN